MAENNSSAPLLPCPFCGGDAVFKHRDGWHSASCADAVCQGLQLMGLHISEAAAARAWNARAPQAVAAQAAPAAVVNWEEAARAMSVEIARNCNSVPQLVFPFLYLGLKKLLATPALPATEDSSAGEQVEVQASTLQEIAIEELYQLGYTFKDGRLIPPDHVGELMSVVQASACGCQYGTCETKANRACRMTAEIREQAQAEAQAEPVAAKFFSFDPADDLVFHETEDDARSAAQKAIDLYREEAGDGWSEEVKRVCWGRVIQQAAENVLPDNFPPNAFSAGAAGSLPSVDYVLTPLYTAPQAQPADALDAAARDVLAERRRQVEVEGFTYSHDDSYTDGELAQAAACYAASSQSRDISYMSHLWPWPNHAWKPSTTRNDLLKAGALILAELERINRARAAMAAAQEGGNAAKEA